MALARVVVVAQGKGGVGKTSLTANVAGLAAASGHRVLAVDLDQQGNLARDLGYEPGDGERLLQAFVAGQPVPVVKGIRPGLDVVPGGPAIGDLLGIVSATRPSCVPGPSHCGTAQAPASTARAQPSACFGRPWDDQSSLTSWTRFESK